MLPVQINVPVSAGALGAGFVQTLSATVIVDDDESIEPASLDARTKYVYDAPICAVVSSYDWVFAPSGGESGSPLRKTTYDVAFCDVVQITVTFGAPALHEAELDALNVPGSAPQIFDATLILNGFESVELFATQTHFDYRNPAALGDLQQWLTEAGLELHGVHAPEMR